MNKAIDSDAYRVAKITCVTVAIAWQGLSIYARLIEILRFWAGLTTVTHQE